MQAKNNKSPRIEPCETLAWYVIISKFDYQEELTIQYVPDKDVSTSPKYFSHIPSFSLYKRPWCQTLSDAFNKSRKTPLISKNRFASNAL